MECFASVFQQRGYGAMVAHLTPDQKVGRSNRSGLILLASDAMDVAMQSAVQDLPEKWEHAALTNATQQDFAETDSFEH